MKQIKSKSKTLLLLTTLALTSFLTLFTHEANATYSDVPPTAHYIDALNRVSSAGIIKGDENGLFRPNKYITREQFIKIIIKATGNTVSQKAESYFFDIEANRWSKPFINTAFEKNIITGMGNRMFNPENEVKVSEACTIAVKAVGYNEDKSGYKWPQNYIRRATDLGFMENITDGAERELTRWAAAIMIDKMFKFVIKDNKFYMGDLNELYTEAIVYEDSKTMDSLNSMQYLTSKGIIEGNVDTKLEVGSKYRLAIYGNEIIKVDKKINSTRKVSIDNRVENKIEYYNKLTKKTYTLEIPFNVPFYQNGLAISYDLALKSMTNGTVAIFGYGNSNNKYDYCVLVESMYSKPEVAKGFNPANPKIGDITIEPDMAIVRDGKNVKINQIEEKDVIYLISNVLDSKKSISILSDKVEGEITSILPNKIAPTSVVIDGKSYELGKYFEISKINNQAGSFNVADKVSALLGYDGKVVDIYALNYKTAGPFVEYVVLGNSTTSTRLLPSQTMLNTGVYYMKDPNIKLVLGHKYELVIDGDTIVKVGEDLRRTLSISTDSFMDNIINYKVNEVKKSYNLPENMVYYYNGTKYTTLTLLKAGMAANGQAVTTNTVFVIVNNEKNNGYEYIVVFDPLYTDPAIFPGNIPTGGKIGGFDLNDTSIVIRYGKKVSPSALISKDVLYQVTDIWGDNKFVQAYSTKVVGIITSINPHAMSPQSVTINGVTYQWGNSATLAKIGVDGSFAAGSSVTLLIGKDNKIADMYGY